jgi:hypothetical protein
MASHAVPDTPKIAAGILFLAALAVAHPAFCQSRFEPVARDPRQAEIVDRIREEQEQNGAYSAALVEPLMALSFLYQESGDRGLAVAAIDRALQVQRANYGLRTLDQAPLILQWIKNAEAMGSFKMAWDLEQALIALARKNPNDLRAAAILRDMGDKRMDLLERYVKGEEFPPQIVLGCYYDPVLNEEDVTLQRNCYAGSRRVAIRGIVTEAQMYYRDAIRVMQRNELYSSDELRELEMQLVRTSYLHGADPTVGKASLRRLLSYEVANDAPWEARVESLVQVADWDLMFANGRTERDAVLSTYEALYEQLEDAGGSRASIERIFAPATPIVLPAFLPNPLASEQTPESKGFIDVAFQITEYGKSRDVEIVGSSGNVTDDAKRNVVRLIDRSSFRPRLADGRVAADAPIVVRYYFTDDFDIVSAPSADCRTTATGPGSASRAFEAAASCKRP